MGVLVQLHHVVAGSITPACYALLCRTKTTRQQSQ